MSEKELRELSSEWPYRHVTMKYLHDSLPVELQTKKAIEAIFKIAISGNFDPFEYANMIVVNCKRFDISLIKFLKNAT